MTSSLNADWDMVITGSNGINIHLGAARTPAHLLLLTWEMPWGMKQTGGKREILSVFDANISPNLRQVFTKWRCCLSVNIAYCFRDFVRNTVLVSSDPQDFSFYTISLRCLIHILSDNCLLLRFLLIKKLWNLSFSDVNTNDLKVAYMTSK